MIQHLKTVISVLILITYGMSTSAQCSYKNTAFKSGEYLSYNLYYNWKFVWVKAGTASFSTVQSVYNGQQAYRGSLITRGSSKVDNFFVLRDTLLCYSSLNLEPLYYRKGAREGDRYTVDELFYSYNGGKCNIRQHRRHGSGSHSWNRLSYDDCVYDMMSIFMRARSFDPSGWKKGNTVDFPMADGNSRYPAKLRYEGKENVKADNGATYRCLKLAYLQSEEGKQFNKIVDFFVTDDDNHVPVRLDMHLRFGSAKAFLVSMRGLRSAVDSKVR